MQPINKTIEKLSATKLATRYNATADEIQRRLIALGYIEVRSGVHYFTEQGRSAGGEYRKNHTGAGDLDGHMVWPADIFDVAKVRVDGKKDTERASVERKYAFAMVVGLVTLIVGGGIVFANSSSWINWVCCAAVIGAGAFLEEKFILRQK